MAGTKTGTSARRRWRIAVEGTVQGVGFRPFVYRLAGLHKLTGWVCNTADGVLIEAEGLETALTRFLDSIRSDAPPLATVSGAEADVIPVERSVGFEIRHSIEGAEIRPIVPPDVATCPDCLSDVISPENRRFGYPFTNCTNCGPRFTIIQGIPYDRPGTTMSGFRMCPECAREYEDPLDRRFHAQPNACPACGPHLSLDGKVFADDREAVALAADLLRAGKVLAIKGLGGFHLACDARNEEAVRTLRTRKGRSGKPFALMCADLEEARRICAVDHASEKLLLSPERPIVLMPLECGGSTPHSKGSGGAEPREKRCRATALQGVADGTTNLGVMLPYTPLHHMLLSAGPPTLVMTSGNLSEEPIAHEDDDARRRLGHIADHILAHDRPIHVPCDDSVARVFGGAPMIIRRARGYVPRPIDLGVEMPQILACGGDLKSTFCLTKGKLALVSQHLGDLDNAPTLDHYERMVDHFRRFFDVEPEVIAHDLHPDYRSTRYAESVDVAQRIGVQHHHAHIVSCMAENRLDGPVIGVAFDGTGYGTDGCIWGGEFLIARRDDFERAAHLAYMPLPGGDAAVRRPGRMALAYLLHASGLEGKSPETPPQPSPQRGGSHPLISLPVAGRVGEGSPELRPPGGLTPEEVEAVTLQISRGLNSPLTSSMGRLFDAVSALLGVCTEVTYEGQAAIELEAVASVPTDDIYPYHLERPCPDPSPTLPATGRELPSITPSPLRGGLGRGQDAGAPDPIKIDVRPMIGEIVAEIARGASVGDVSSRFHSTVADMTVRVCGILRERTGLNQVALSGGVFQNVLLLGMVTERLTRHGFEVFIHRIVPCNDGGLSLGQAVVAAGRYMR